MAGGQDNDKLRDDNLVTPILANNVSFTGGNLWERLLVGPYFNINLIDVSDFNLSSAGVVWRRRLCSKGEYLSASNFCEQCPSYQFSVVEQYPGHSERQCSDAPNSAYAPGGAVLVPLSGGERMPHAASASSYSGGGFVEDSRCAHHRARTCTAAVITNQQPQLMNHQLTVANSHWPHGMSQHHALRTDAASMN
jgi:hypothetical protein